MRPNLRSYPILDADVVESTSNITVRVNQAQKHADGPVIRPDRVWEKNMVLTHGSVLYDPEDGTFKMWYMCGGGHVAYATSEDGLTWEKPELDVVLWRGRRTNIVIERGEFGHYYEISGVWKDEGDQDPGRRYKMGFVSIQRDYSGRHEARYHPGQRRGFGTASARVAQSAAPAPVPIPITILGRYIYNQEAIRLQDDMGLHGPC